MKKATPTILVILALLGLMAFSFNADVQKPKSFAPGETLQYRLHYGFINAGEAVMNVNPTIQQINGRPCYSIEVVGKTIGTFEWFIRVRNTYSTLLDTAQMIPLRFHRNIEEGKYRLKETSVFDHEGKKVVITKEQPDKYEEKSFEIPSSVQDMVSGYYYLRNIDFNKLKKGEIVGVNAFFEDKLYDFRVRYLGKEKIKTAFGKVNAHKMEPVMPENEMFDGESSIKVWLSDDLNRIPLKIRAEMFIGGVEVDLKGYSGLKYPFAARN